MMDEFKFRVWVNGRMVYPDSANKPCEFLIGQDGSLVSFPNKMDKTYDPVRFEGAVYMRYTGWTDSSRDYDIYEGDVIRDYDGYMGLVVWRPEQGQWVISYKSESMAIDEFPQKGSLTCIGNIYQHPDWENWRGYDNSTLDRIARRQREPSPFSQRYIELLQADVAMTERYKPTVEVSTEWVFDITHAVVSLAQFFLTHSKGGDVKKEEALIEQGCEYLRSAEKQGGDES